MECSLTAVRVNFRRRRHDAYVHCGCRRGRCIAHRSVAVAAARPTSGARAVHIHHDQHDDDHDDDSKHRGSNHPWTGHGTTSERAHPGPACATNSSYRAIPCGVTSPSRRSVRSPGDLYLHDPRPAKGSSRTPRPRERKRRELSGINRRRQRETKPYLGSDPDSQSPVGGCVPAVSSLRFINLGSPRVLADRSMQDPESPRRTVDVGRRWRPTSRVKVPERNGDAQRVAILERERHSGRRPVRQHGVRRRNQVPVITPPTAMP